MATKSILIVDDMKTVRMKLKQVCKDIGIENIYEAADGNQALQLLEGLSVDLILSDWNMPNLTASNSWPRFARIRSWPRFLLSSLLQRTRRALFSNPS